MPRLRSVKEILAELPPERRALVIEKANAMAAKLGLPPLKVRRPRGSPGASTYRFRDPDKRRAYQRELMRARRGKSKTLAQT